MKKDSIKNQRINQEVQRELSTLIAREVKDPRIQPMTSVIAVEVATDLKTAKVFVSVLGSEEEQAATLAGLKNAAPYLRTLLAQRVNMRNTPQLQFFLNQSIAYGIDMARRIDEVMRDMPVREEDQASE